MAELIDKSTMLDWVQKQVEAVTKKQVAGSDGIFTREVLTTMQRDLSAFENEINAMPTTTEAEIRAKAEHTYENCHNITCRRKCQKDGYNMAIDEFAEKLGILCENSAMALDRYNGRPLYNKDGKWHDLINEVAEQLKEE